MTENELDRIENDRFLTYDDRELLVAEIRRLQEIEKAALAVVERFPQTRGEPVFDNLLKQVRANPAP